MFIPNDCVRDLLERKICHEIHESENKSFRGCRRRWSWVFQDNYYPPTTAKPLEFGIAYHRAMETLFNPTTWRFNHLALGALAEKAFVEECESQRAAFLRNRDEYVLDAEWADDYDERLALGRGMLAYFVQRRLPEIQANYSPTHVEVSFDVPLFHPETKKVLICKCKGCRRAFAKAGGGRWYGNPVVFSGRVDAIFVDKFGGYWIWDLLSGRQRRNSVTLKCTWN